MALNPKAVNESSVEGSGSSVEYKHREYLPAEVIRCKEKKRGQQNKSAGETH